MNLVDYVTKWAAEVKREHYMQTELVAQSVLKKARELAISTHGIKNAESGLTKRTGKFLKSISMKEIVEPDGSVAFELYYDKNICSYAGYLENGTRKIKPFKVLARAFDNI
jgi:hypothetical protein